MLQHIVMWKLKDSAMGMDKAALALETKKRLEGLMGQVPSIRAIHIGVNTLPSETASDIVLVSSFDDMAGMDEYQKHPKHLEVVEFVKQVYTERRAVDYLT
jgi:hypothetical protein